MNSVLRSALMVVVAAAAPYGCSGDANSGPGDVVGEVSLALELSPDSRLETVSYQIAGTGFLRSGTIDVKDSGKISAQIGDLPIGTGYTITLTAADASNTSTSCSGSATFDVTRGRPAEVKVHMICGRPVTKGSAAVSATTNICPSLSAITAVSADAYVGKSIALVASGADADKGPSALSYSWTAPNGWGASGSSVSFPCATVGAFTLTATVSDGDTACSGLAGGTYSASISVSCSPLAPANFVQFIVASDVHYGITRAAFRGGSMVDAHVVNAALASEINTLPATVFPSDDGLRAGQPIGAIDYLMVTGDIANRMEGSGSTAIQSAATSWAQFQSDYMDGLTVKDHNGLKTSLLLTPGNHDVSNAIGFYKTMTPTMDATSMAGIFNYMLKPSTPLTKDTYDYATNKIHYSLDVSGVHFVSINVWPDSGERAWLAGDLAGVSSTTPVILFMHDQPEVEAKHFTNPNGLHDINATDKFEGMLAEQLADGTTINAPTTIEQRALATFLKAHGNIVAYFHGNSNKNEFYDYRGPDGDITLPTFRVDSPMKGDISSVDETKLSVQVAVLDPASQTLTVRECLWNPVPGTGTAVPVAWGASRTISLATH